MALEVKQQLQLDALHLIPCGTPVHRTAPVAKAIDRLAMLRASIVDVAGLIADDREIKRSGPSYSIDTLEELSEPDTRLFLVLGSDAFVSIDTWHRWPELLELAHLVILQRPGVKFPRDGIAQTLIDRYWGSRDQLEQQRAGMICLLEVTALDISSSQVRHLVGAGRDPAFLVPAAVRDYIFSENLYAA